MPPFSNHLTLFDLKMIYPKMYQICVEFHFNIWTQSVPCCSTHPGSAYMEVRVVRTGRTMPMLGFALMEVPFPGETWGNHEFQKFHQMISEFDWICYVIYVVVFLDMMGASLFIINMGWWPQWARQTGKSPTWQRKLAIRHEPICWRISYPTKNMDFRPALWGYQNVYICIYILYICVYFYIYVYLHMLRSLKR